MKIILLKNKTLSLIFISLMGFILLTSSFVYVTAQPSCIAPSTGMIGWWPGDGNANDIQGISSGSINGEVSFSSGEVEDAFSFAGNGHVTTSLNSIIGGTGSGTMDFWIKIPIAPTSAQHPVGIDNLMRFITTPFGELSVSVTVNTNSGPIGLTTGTIFPAGTDFHHVAIVYDSSIGKGILYLDGIEVDQTGPVDPGTKLVSSGQGGLTIGDVFQGGEAFVGSIDEIEVYNLALTQSQIQSIFNAGNAGKCKPTPSERVDEIIGFIENFDLPTGVENSLKSNLQQIEQLLNDGNPNNDGAVCGILSSFLQKVNERLENNQITQEQAIILEAKANIVITELGC
jgi:Concanavalin A-like lectin/glucanases superfamily